MEGHNPFVARNLGDLARDHPKAFQAVEIAAALILVPIAFGLATWLVITAYHVAGWLVARASFIAAQQLQIKEGLEVPILIAIALGAAVILGRFSRFRAK